MVIGLLQFMVAWLHIIISSEESNVRLFLDLLENRYRYAELMGLTLFCSFAQADRFALEMTTKQGDLVNFGGDLHESLSMVD